MKWLRRLIRLINILAAIAVVAIGVGAWLLSSEAGSAWLVRFVERRAQPAVSIASVDGTILGRLRLGGLRVGVPGASVTADRVEVSFDALSLLTGAVIIDDLVIDHASYEAQPDAEPARSSGSVLPVAVVVRRARVAELDVATGGRQWVLTGTRLSLSLVGSRLKIDRIATQAEQFDVSGQGELVLGPAPNVKADIDYSGAFRQQTWTGMLRIDGTLPELHVHQQLSSPFDLTVDGSARVAAPLSFDVDAEWSGLFVPGFDAYGSDMGTAHAAGRIDAFEFSGEGDLHAAGRTGRFSLRGRRDGGRVSVESLSLDADADAGRVSATGSVALNDRTWNMSLEVDDLDPAAFAPTWPGRVSGTGRLSGRLDPQLRVELDDLHLDGSLREFPMTLDGALAYEAPNRWRVDGLNLRSGANVVTVDGRVADSVDLRLTASIASAEQLSPQVAGSAQVQLAASGSRSEPRLRGTITGQGLAYRDVRAASLRLAGEVGLSADAPADVMLEATDVTRGTLDVSELDGRLSGTAAEHSLELDARAEQWAAHSTAHGDFSDGRWQGSLDRLDITQAALGAWRLPEPSRLELGSERIAIPTTCLVQSEARVCFALNLGGDGGDRLRINATDFDLQALGPLLPEGVSLQGVYQLSLNLENLRASPVGTLSMDGGRTVVRATRGNAGPNDTVDTVIDTVGVDANIENWRLRLNAQLSGREAGDVHLTTDVEDVRREDSPVSADLSVSWPDLGILSLLSPDVGEVGGTLKMNFMMGGALNDPQVRADAAWDDGSIEAPQWGFKIDDIEARATSPDGSTMRYDATGRAGDGSVALRGTTQLSARAGWRTQATLTGDQIRAVQLPDAQIFVTPDLQIDARLPQIDVSGTVRVPRASISLEQLPGQAVSPSRDVVVHGRGSEPRAPARPLHVNARLNVGLGDNVHYTGPNLDAMLSGEMRVDYESGQPASASGAVGIDGTYAAYGQTLDIERGRLVFNGPIDDPTLDVRAARTIGAQASADQASGSQIVGVQLTGTLKSPQTRIFSEPALSEADALAYLLFGQPLASSGQAENATLQRAAIAMGLQQALPVVQRIGETLGLDELSVRPTDVDAGALMAGKYLSPKVYVRYSYGLFNRIGGLLLRFRVNDRLSIETRSGEQKSMDLLYTVEKP
jgi:translocation and assembly module TamB